MDETLNDVFVSLTNSEKDLLCRLVESAIICHDYPENRENLHYKFNAIDRNIFDCLSGKQKQLAYFLVGGFSTYGRNFNGQEQT